LDALQVFCERMLPEHQPGAAEADQDDASHRDAAPLLEHQSQ
jgi:hypothetical protein